MQVRFIKYIFLSLLIFVLFSSVAQAQKSNPNKKSRPDKVERRLTKADEFYFGGEFDESIRRYKKLLKKMTGRNQKAPVYYKIGDAYYQIYDYRKARTYLKRAAKYDLSNREAWVKQAECLKILEKFDEAIAVCDEYIQVVGPDTVIDAVKLSVNKTQEWIDLPTRYNASPVRKFNTRDNDFSPYVVEKDGFDHIYFSTNRKGVLGKRKSQINGQRFSDIMLCKKNRQGEWDDLETLDSLNTEFDEGTPALINSGATMYFTACKIEKGKPLGCQVYTIVKTGSEWLHPERVPIVGDSISIGHPAFSPTGDKMYFSARMTGGFGGADIWYVEKDGGDWSKPKNMGPYVNSYKDELFPFMRADSVLYFSSDRSPNMGGLDIFAATPDGKYRWVVKNMKPPFSSAGNDFGLYYYADEEKGYFTSDRKGSKGEDIYFFEKPNLNFSIEGFVKDKDTGEVVDSALVHLIGSDGTIFTDTTSEEEGFFDFKLKPNTDYVFVVHKTGYFNGKARLTTDSLFFDNLFEYEILLESTNKVFDIPNIEFEFGSRKLTPLAEHSLDSLIQVLNNNPNIIVELSAHTDMIGSEENNMKLSLDRAESVRSYLNSHGIMAGRMTTKGYGESKPVEILENNPKYDWLFKGDVLTPEFVDKLTKEKQEIANQMNRRTELRVIGHDFVPSLD